MLSHKYETATLESSCSLKTAIFAGTRDPTRDSVITHVATQIPAIVPSPEKSGSSHRNHVAWTSVRQERWEGELLVQGQIPLWLVCALHCSCYFIKKKNSKQ